MLLVLDVGNTNTVLGLYRLASEASEPSAAPEMVANWRITTPSSVQTSDEFGVLLRNLFELKGLEIGVVTGIAISSVVRGDAVSDWNAIAIQTIAGVPSHPGATALLDSAMVQVAVYDAVEAISGRFRPYHVHIPGALPARRMRPWLKPPTMFS